MPEYNTQSQRSKAYSLKLFARLVIHVFNLTHLAYCCNNLKQIYQQWYHSLYQRSQQHNSVANAPFTRSSKR